MSEMRDTTTTEIVVDELVKLTADQGLPAPDLRSIGEDSLQLLTFQRNFNYVVEGEKRPSQGAGAVPEMHKG